MPATGVNTPALEVPFAEPWQARVFAAGVIAVEQLGLPWDAFRDQLKVAIGAAPEQPYFESFMDALDALLATSSVS
jgi:hypothetical protein